MAHVRIRRRLLRWGNSFGIRITRQEAERLAAGERTNLDIEVRTAGGGFDPADLPTMRLGGGGAQQHDQWAAEGAEAQLDGRD